MTERLLQFDGHTFPVPVTTEFSSKRHSSAAIRHLGIHLRIAGRLPAAQRASHIATLTEATKQRIQTALAENLLSYPLLHDGATWTAYDERFMLHLTASPLISTVKVQVQQHSVSVRYPSLEGDDYFTAFVSVHQALRAKLALHFKPRLIEEILATNAETIQSKALQTVRWREQQTRWGSCSTGGHLNLSNRLLFVPKQLRDYVFWHELCHLVEHNHSHRFWALVERYMPDYLARRQRLKRYL